MTRLADRPASQPNPTESSPSPGKVYDRSSFEGDFLVTVPGQTAGDFERYAPESRFCEFFDGTVYMPSPVSDQHQELVIFLTTLLDLYRRRRAPELQLLSGPAVLRLAADRRSEPDVFVRHRGQGEVCLVVEIVSPSHRAYDLDFKADLYRAAGLPEVWYVDPAARAFHRDRPIDGAYARETLHEGRIAAERIPGFWVDVAWFWADPPADPSACLAEILADPPA